MHEIRSNGALNDLELTDIGSLRRKEFSDVPARARHGVLVGMRWKILCGARTRRGSRCKCKAIETKRGKMRCRLHGGLSTGPKTCEGRARIAEAQRKRWAEYRALPWRSSAMSAKT